MTRTPAPIIASVARTIWEHDLIRPGDTLIVAVSGGADSTALLRILSGLPEIPLNLVAAHLNHCLRGSESDGDEQFCRQMAAELSIPFECRRADIRALALRLGCGLEDAGRRARAEFLEEIRLIRGGSAVALAHHADDQAETVLMRLLRGAGTAGLGAMRHRNDRNQIRPLLNISRQEIEQYLKAAGISWREDASNADVSFLRNRIRHQLLPLLEGINPAVRQRLRVTAQLLADDDHLLHALSHDEFQRLAHLRPGRVSFDVAGLSTLHPALAGRVIRHAVRYLTGDVPHLSRDHIADTLALLADGPPNRSLTLPRRLTASREYGHLILHHHSENGDQPTTATITCDGLYQLWDGMRLRVESQPRLSRPGIAAPEQVDLDLELAPFPWLVRTFVPGDRIRPRGMTGSKKLKDFFIDEKIPRPLRRRIPLVFSSDRLIWVAGLRLAENAASANDSVRTTRVTLIPPEAVE